MSIDANTSGIVLGSNGYLGRNLVHFLMRKGCKLRAFDLQDRSVAPGVDYSTVDVADSGQLDCIDWNVDFVFMFAGLTGTANGFKRYREFVNVNEIGLLGVLDAVRNSGRRPRIVYPSTRLVYEGSDRPSKEDAFKNPKTIYAVNKLACENILHVYMNAYSLPFTIYRICVPYGNAVDQNYSYGTIGAMLRQAKEESLIRLYGDGSLRRTFTHVEDVCHQIIATCADERTVNEIFNISGEDLSLRDAAMAIAERYGARLEFVEWPENDLRIESGHTVFDATKLLGLDWGAPKHRFATWVRQSS
jgi:UDP-glucose 4-epimerase